ncbi:unnamed protein product [Tilletia laevis]|nr:unnamed protein product [Tilletia caries]CAD6948133.1 unnamed protein product [Tilletia laevis]
MAMENTRLVGSFAYEKAIVIFNTTGLGLHNMDWQCVLFFIKCLESRHLLARVSSAHLHVRRTLEPTPTPSPGLYNIFTSYGSASA